MDSTDNFFGYDASTQLEDDDARGLLECDDEYDALNNETFGSAAVGDDWEEDHKQFTSITEAEKVKRKLNKDSLFGDNGPFRLRDLHHNEEKGNPIDQLFLNASTDQRRLFDRNVSSDGLSSSPGNSIWSPTNHFDTNDRTSETNFHNTLGSSFNNQFNDFSSYNSAFSNGAKMHKPPNSFLESLYELQNTHSFKTVEEIEGEFKRPQSNITKLSAITVEELEKQLARQALSQSLSKQANSSFPDFALRTQPPNLQNSQQNFLNSSNRLIPNNYFPNQHNSINPNAGLSRSYGTSAKNNLPFHPLLNANQNKSFSGNGPNYLNNVAGHPMLNNGTIGNLQPNRPYNQFFNRMGDNNRGVMPNGSNFQRFQNIMRNNGSDRRNFEQNFRFDQQRNFMENRGPNHRDQGSMNCSNDRGIGGGRERRDSDAEWEEWQNIRREDPYAGLMTPREKSWLKSIQAMQLQTENPYHDDYYFVMSSVRQQRRREEDVIELDGLQMLIPDKGKEGKEYEPPRLENSLGKLQVASVNAPRKIIDLHVVHLDSSHPTTSLQRDMRKHRHLLLHIEKLYTIQIELDDLERKIRSLPDCPTRDSFRSKCRQLVTKLWNGLINPHESFVQILCIKKGKTLAARLLSWVHENEAEHLLATIIQNLSMLTKKDLHDKRLPMFWLAADRFFASLNTASLVSFGIMMGKQLKPQKSNFIPAVDSKLGFSVILALLVRGETLWQELCNDEAWLQFLKDVISGLSAISEDSSNLQPLPSINLAASPKHPASQLSRCKDIDSDSLNKALETLKISETFIMKNFPKYSSSLNNAQDQKKGSEVNTVASMHNIQY